MNNKSDKKDNNVKADKNKTVKSVTKSSEAKKTKPSKGEYGYASRYKNRKIILTLICFLCIVVDVLIGLIMFQTRATLFTIVACVMSLPFAKNLIGYIMVVKFKPLTTEQYEKVARMGETEDALMCYDISISDTEKMYFFPCVAIYGNNVIGLAQAMRGESIESFDLNKKAASGRDIHHIEYIKKNEKTLAMINDSSKIKARCVAVLTLQDLEKELYKVASNVEEKSDSRRKNKNILKERLLEMGV